jgi:hypothetical protein
MLMVEMRGADDILRRKLRRKGKTWSDQCIDER